MTEIYDRTLLRMGDSLGVALPPGWLRYNDLKLGDTVRIIVDQDVKITPVKEGKS